MDKLLLKEDSDTRGRVVPAGFYTYMEIPPGSDVLDCHWHEEMEFLLLTSGRA